MRFKYLGDTYTIPKSTFDFCMKRNLTRKLFAEAQQDNPQTERKTFFIITVYDPEFRWFCASSRNPKYYKRFNNPRKHLAIPNLTPSQCKYLTDITSDIKDFRQAIALAKEAVKTVYEIS